MPPTRLFRRWVGERAMRVRRWTTTPHPRGTTSKRASPHPPLLLRRERGAKGTRRTASFAESERKEKTMKGNHLIRRVLLLFCCAMLLAMTTGAAQPPGTRVDLIVMGDFVVTMDQQQPVIENGAVAIDDGEIVAVG